MNPPMVQISTSDFAAMDAAPLRALEAAGFVWRTNPYKRRLSVEESKRLLADAVGVIAGTEVLDAEVFDAAPGLRAIARVGTGMDAVDLAAAQARGIQVSNTLEAHVDAVAELALAGLLNGFRGHMRSDRAMRAGIWERSLGRLLHGKTVGLIGLGRVSKALIHLLQAFKVTVLAHDPNWDEAFASQFHVRRVALGELLETADAISLHVSASKGVALIGAPQLALLKPDAVVVNTARGSLLDELALLQFLTQNPRATAVLDVFSQEPYAGQLLNLPNVLLSPHVGAYAQECRLDMEMQAVQNLLKSLAAA